MISSNDRRYQRQMMDFRFVGLRMWSDRGTAYSGGTHHGRLYRSARAIQCPSSGVRDAYELAAMRPIIQFTPETMPNNVFFSRGVGAVGSQMLRLV